MSHPLRTEACPKQLGTATFVLGSANQGQAWVACYFDFGANRCAELNETGHTPEEAVARLWLALRRLGRNNCDEYPINKVAKRLWEIGDIVGYWRHLGGCKLAWYLG